MAHVRELMTPFPIKVPQETDIAECARVMWRLGFRHLPVVDDAGRYVGVVSDFDLLQHGELVGDDGTWLDRGPDRVRAARVARTQATVVREDTDLEQVLSDMRDTGRDVVVVVDGHRRPVGIVTEHDAVRWARGFLGDDPVLVGDSGTIVKVDLYNPGLAAFDTMVSHGLRHLLVYDGDSLLGVISWRDLVVEDVLGWRKATVRDLLRSDRPVVLPLGVGLRLIAERMVALRIGCVPLIDEDGTVRAVVGRGDIIGAGLRAARA